MRGIAPSTFRSQRKQEGSFRCEECDGVYPKSFKRTQDGRDVCYTTCYRPLGRTDLANRYARAQELLATGVNQFEENPVTSRLRGQQLVYTFDPTPVVLITGGGPASVDITGINIDNTITWSTSDPGITVSFLSIDPDEASATLLFSLAPGVAAGYYDLFCSIRTPAIRKRFIKVE